MNVLFGLSLCASNRVGLIHLTLATTLSVFLPMMSLCAANRKRQWLVPGAWLTPLSHWTLSPTMPLSSLFFVSRTFTHDCIEQLFGGCGLGFETECLSWCDVAALGFKIPCPSSSLSWLDPLSHYSTAPHAPLFFLFKPIKWATP